MATQAQIRPGATQISGDIAAVGLMTRTAALFGKGLMLMLPLPGALLGMAAVAHLPFGLIEEERMRTGVGLMTVTAAPLLKGNMAETGFELSGTVFMALKAALGLCFFQQRGMFCPMGRMTRTALALKQGGMNGGRCHIQADTTVTFGTEFILGAAQQPRCRGVVKLMAGAALLLLHRRVLYPGIGCWVGMAFYTYLTLRRAQKIVGPCGCLMRGVTFEAIARAGIGMVGTPPLVEIGMTPEAQAMLFTLEKRRAVAGVWLVTRRAVPLHYGGMPVSAPGLILHLGVAAQAQPLL